MPAVPIHSCTAAWPGHAGQSVYEHPAYRSVERLPPPAASPGAPPTANERMLVQTPTGHGKSILLAAGSAAATVSHRRYCGRLMADSGVLRWTHSIRSVRGSTSTIGKAAEPADA